MTEAGPSQSGSPGRAAGPAGPEPGPAARGPVCPSLRLHLPARGQLRGLLGDGRGRGDTGRTAKSWLTSLEGTRSRGFSNRFLPGNLSWRAVPSLPSSVLSSHTFPLSFPPRAPDPGGNEGTASLVPGGRGAGAAGWSWRGHTQPGSGSSRAPAAPGRPQSVGPVRPLMK